MDRKELIISTAKDILIAAMAKDSQIDLDLGLSGGETQLDCLGERLKTISKAVESALMGLND